MRSLLKHPSAWVPLALSLGMVAMLATLLFMHGVPAPDPNADEGTAAHLFQIWLVLEALLIPLFAVKWVPHAPKQALIILAMQIAAVLVACFPVFYFQL